MAHEDPHGIYDSEAKKWRLLLCEHGRKYQAAMWESDHWDHGFQRLAGPVDVDSTGTLIQKFGDTRYALFGSADRKIYVRSYPDLQPVGELKMDLPPWNDDHGTQRLAQRHPDARGLSSTLHCPHDGSSQLPGYAQTQLDIWRTVFVSRLSESPRRLIKT